MLDILEQHMTEAFGKDAIERIDHGTPSAQRHAAVERFNQNPRLLSLLSWCSHSDKRP